MTRKQRRLTMIGSALAVLAFAAGLVLYAMRDSIVFFSTPSTVAEKHLGPGKRFRLGGLVEQGSLRTFLGQTLYVTLVFGSTVAIAGYWVGQFLGRMLAIWPIGKFMKKI